MMKKVLILVEGQTEETFVRDVLEPHFQKSSGIFFQPVLIRTKRTATGQTFKGGVVSYQQVKNDLRRLLGDRSALLVTTMLDYYGLPQGFPGLHNLPQGTPYDRVAHLQRQFSSDIDDRRFLPFITLHEFEALVLVDPKVLEEIFVDASCLVNDLLKDIGNRLPEEIDDGQESHPAARICRYFPQYQKNLHGLRAVQRIGLNTIRKKCRHFDEWLQKIETVANA